MQPNVSNLGVEDYNPQYIVLSDQICSESEIRTRALRPHTALMDSVRHG